MAERAQSRRNLHVNQRSCRCPCRSAAGCSPDCDKHQHTHTHTSSHLLCFICSPFLFQFLNFETHNLTRKQDCSDFNGDLLLVCLVKLHNSSLSIADLTSKGTKSKNCLFQAALEDHRRRTRIRSYLSLQIIDAAKKIRRDANLDLVKLKLSFMRTGWHFQIK